MGLESATYISQLVATNPTAGDPKSQGDDHLRLLKTVLQAQFPNLGAAAVTVLATELNALAGLTGGTLQTQLAAKAPLASPALTGMPTAPTASAGTNSTQLATTAYADGAVGTEATARAAADSALNTAKANKAGDTYTGTQDFTGAALTAATQAGTDNSTKVATTAMVQAAALNQSTNIPAQAGNGGKVLTTDGSTATWQYALPPGTLLQWPTETVPTGFLECDGSSLLRAGTYAGLFAVLGTTYGAADGTHFNLPDFRGRFLRSWAHGSSNDPDRASRTAVGVGGATMAGGDRVGTQQSYAVESHSHSGAASSSGPVNGRYGNLSDGTTPSTGSYGGNETRPVNAYVMIIIKF